MRELHRSWRGGGYSSTPSKGIKDGFFFDLPKKYKKPLINIIARISEISFRRGAQQAASWSKWYYEHYENWHSDDVKKCLKWIVEGRFRYGYSSDVSPRHMGLTEDGKVVGRSSLEELQTQYGWQALDRIFLSPEYLNILDNNYHNSYCSLDLGIPEDAEKYGEPLRSTRQDHRHVSEGVGSA